MRENGTFPPHSIRGHYMVLPFTLFPNSHIRAIQKLTTMYQIIGDYLVPQPEFSYISPDNYRADDYSNRPIITKDLC